MRELMNLCKFFKIFKSLRFDISLGNKVFYKINIQKIRILKRLLKNFKCKKKKINHSYFNIIFKNAELNCKIENSVNIIKNVDLYHFQTKVL